MSVVSVERLYAARKLRVSLRQAALSVYIARQTWLACGDMSPRMGYESEKMSDEQSEISFRSFGWREVTSAGPGTKHSPTIIVGQ